MSTTDEEVITKEEQELANQLSKGSSEKAEAAPSDKEVRKAERKEMWRTYLRTTLIVWFSLAVTSLAAYMIAYAIGWRDGYNYGRKDPDGHIEPFNGTKMWEAFTFLFQSWGWTILVLFILLLIAAIFAVAIRWDRKKSKPKNHTEKH